MSLGQSTFFIKSDKSVMCCGQNNNSQLGLGDTTTRYSPTLIPDLTDVQQIASSELHTIAVLKNGIVKAFGRNLEGQLGINNASSIMNTPSIVPNLTNVKQVACGYSYTIFLLNDGTVKMCGKNDYGELGFYDRDVYNINIPTLIPNLTNVKQVSCGYTHTLFLLEDGTVKACGYNVLGQLGMYDKTNRTTPTTIPGLTNVKQISCGYYFSLFLLNDGTVKSCGQDNYGQLGGSYNTLIPDTIPNLTNVKQISCGSYFSLFLLNDGTVKSCGYNAGGNLGLGDTTNRTTPTLIPDLSSVKQISGGYYHSVFILNDGTVKSCGYNNGPLGLGDTTTRTTPTLIPNLNNVKLLMDVINDKSFYYLFKDNNEFKIVDDFNDTTTVEDINNYNVKAYTNIDNINKNINKFSNFNVVKIVN